jgi:lactoylglutathione lyase
MTMTFAMTKLVVADLEGAAAFYTRVCELQPVDRIAGDGFAEIILHAAGSASAMLVLLETKGTPPPTPGECMLVFETDDLARFVERAVGAGATIVHPPRAAPELGLAYAIVTDPEGHAVEAIQYLAPETR